MIPFFLYPLLGFLTMEQIQAIFMSPSAKKYKDYTLSNRAVNTIKLYETLHPYGMNVGDGYSTIGYGTVNCFYDNGQPLGRSVRFGETLTQLKTAMGYTTLTDEQFAVRLMVNHSRVSSYRLVSRDLDDLGVSYYEGLAEALSEWSYGTGCAFYKTIQRCNNNNVILQYQDFLKKIKNAGSNVKLQSMAYFHYRISYLKNLRQFSTYAFGWVKRAYISAMLVQDSSFDTAYWKKQLDKNDRNYLKNLIRQNFDASYILGW